MRIIGRTNEGGVLLETSLYEYAGLLSVATALVGLPSLVIAAPRLAQVAPPDHPYPCIPPPIHNGKTTERPIKTKVSKGDRHKKCEICGDPFVDHGRTNQRKICKKPGCIKEKKRQWQIAWYQNKTKKSGKKMRLYRKSPVETPSLPTAKMINPADPMLTDEERVKAARLAGIRARMP